MTLKVSTNFRPFILCNCFMRLNWMTVLVLQWIVIVSDTNLKLFGTSFQSFTYFLYFGSWCWSWCVHISKLKWWRDDVIFILLHHLFLTLSWFWGFRICDCYVALLPHLFNVWFGSWFYILFNNSLINFELLSFFTPALFIYIWLHFSDFIILYRYKIFL